MFSWLWKKKEEPKVDQATAEWWIFNHGTNLEFAECSLCGKEVEPDVTLRAWYPDVCPKCGAAIEKRTLAEDVK